MITNATRIKEYAKEHGLKIYEICNIVGVGQSNFYTTYMHSTDDAKYQKVVNAVDEYLKKVGATNA